MKDVRLGPSEWEGARIECEKCGTSFTAESQDVRIDQFKKRGTYWFDGSADRAGLYWGYFVYCPACKRLHMIPTEQIPVLMQQALAQKHHREKARYQRPD